MEVFLRGGGLVFLLAGGRLMDRFGRKKEMLAMLVMLNVWMLVLLLSVLSDNFYAILIGMFMAVGDSTLPSTTVKFLFDFSHTIRH